MGRVVYWTVLKKTRDIVDTAPMLTTKVTLKYATFLGLVTAWAACMPNPDAGDTTGFAGTSGAAGTNATQGAAGTSGGATAGSGASSSTGGTIGAGGTAGSPAGAAGSTAGAGGAAGSTAGAAGSSGGATAGRGGAGGAAGSGATAGRGGGAGGNAGRGGGGGTTGTGGRGGTTGTGGGAGTAVGTAGGSGSAGLGGASLCTAGRYLLCEGFEGTAVGTTPPAGWTRHGNASVADDQAARGTHALKVGAADSGERRFYFTDSESFGAGHWGRIFYKVQTPVPDAFVHSSLVVLQGTGPTNGASEYRVVDTVKQAVDTPDVASQHQFLWNVQIQGGSEFGKQGPYDWKFDGKWHCAEWHIDGATQAYQFFFDGAEVTQMRIMNGAGNYGSGSNRTDIPMVFTDLKVGWNNYQAAPPGFVAWIDEVAVDTARIGCGN